MRFAYVCFSRIRYLPVSRGQKTRRARGGGGEARPRRRGQADGPVRRPPAISAVAAGLSRPPRGGPSPRRADTARGQPPVPRGRLFRLGPVRAPPRAHANAPLRGHKLPRVSCGLIAHPVPRSPRPRALSGLVRARRRVLTQRPLPSRCVRAGVAPPPSTPRRRPGGPLAGPTGSPALDRARDSDRRRPRRQAAAGPSFASQPPPPSPGIPGAGWQRAALGPLEGPGVTAACRTLPRSCRPRRPPRPPAAGPACTRQGRQPARPGRAGRTRLGDRIACAALRTHRRAGRPRRHAGRQVRAYGGGWRRHACNQALQVKGGGPECASQ